jgi:integrase
MEYQNGSPLPGPAPAGGAQRHRETNFQTSGYSTKKVLQALPSSRNTKPELKAMPLMQVIKEPGHKKIAAKTINSHIQVFKTSYDCAERHGHSPHTLFEGMKVKKDKASESERKPFAPDQARLIYTELTENLSGLVRKDSHKWGMLLGMFTGARLNEICQLDIADVQQDGDTWFLNITDEGDDNKRIMSKAGRRKVPLHSELIRARYAEGLHRIVDQDRFDVKELVYLG